MVPVVRLWTSSPSARVMVLPSASMPGGRLFLLRITPIRESSFTYVAGMGVAFRS